MLTRSRRSTKQNAQRKDPEKQGFERLGQDQIGNLRPLRRNRPRFAQETVGKLMRSELDRHVAMQAVFPEHRPLVGSESYVREMPMAVPTPATHEASMALAGM
jgi:hypothetical protein